MQTFTALSEPSRRRLLAGLLDGERTVSYLVEQTGLSQPAVSKHLRVLRDAGLVTVRPDGQRRLYRLEAEPLAELDAWLEPYRKFWMTRLDALERHLNAPETEEQR